MPFTHRSSWTWKGYRWLQLLLNCLPLIGLAFVLSAVRANYHDRQSLQWPAVSGTIMQCDAQYRRYSGHGGWRVSISYRYQVNGQSYVGNRVSLWNPNGGGPPDEVNTFAADHPPRSNVIVYYDPLHPETAVLEPGADEGTNRLLIWCGSIIFVLMFWIVWKSNRFFNKLVAWRKANPPRILPSRRREQPQALPLAFASYEPGRKRKLNCIPDKDALEQFLGGDDDKALQAWTPEDRVIDAKGQEYRLVPNTDKTRYQLEPTSQTWTAEKLLEVAVADARLLKKDDAALRRQVIAVPEEKRIPVLMKCIDDLPGAPFWEIVGIILFLLLFICAVLAATALFFALIGFWMARH
jgi:hypothetical protein